MIVLDSLGIGAAADAARFGDAGADTLGHIAEKMPNLHIPNLRALGIANLKEMKGQDPIDEPRAYCARLKEASNGKDTMTGHWEMMGLYTEKPFQTFTDTGFPAELMRELEARTGYHLVGNIAASGTQILEDMAEEATEKRELIVYTSADSVLQIAASEETIGLDELYRCCEIARELTMREEWKVGRVIARPYTGRHPGEFVRTSNRHDYALSPPRKTVLDALNAQGISTISVGKIADIFNHRAISEENHSDSSVHGMEQTIAYAKKDFEGLCFVNLVDFDAKWGHRRDPFGYGSEIERFDEKLGELLPLLREDDLLILTADHGNDPIHGGTDHTREDVFLLLYSPSLKGGILPSQETFGVIGATIADNYSVPAPEGLIGETLLDLLK